MKINRIAPLIRATTVTLAAPVAPQTFQGGNKSDYIDGLNAYAALTTIRRKRHQRDCQHEWFDTNELTGAKVCLKCDLCSAFGASNGQSLSA